MTLWPIVIQKPTVIGLTDGFLLLFVSDDISIICRLILKAGSAVLYAMIPGPMAEKEPCIRIPDVQPGAFRLMLKYYSI